ncbi:MAG TPA: hypothetical protein VE954_30715 [Oligoflexus sp.]|uniref:hypothetical protein n=1 Tax=Oligoflexus sp. TaxID=1971216 RepID=UPI002D4A989D|nr:hypothetical protein [Oligoflexus sp.]HYX37498.1 hypothetical protein [Oligoflexus sp.]
MLQVTVEQQDQQTRLILAGPIDDLAGPVLRATLPQIKKQVLINFSAVEYFNSLGIRTWVNFLRVLRDGREVAYEHCPMDFLQQINMMPALSQGVEIQSFQADFACKSCGLEKTMGFTCRVSKEALLEELGRQICERCGSSLSLQDDAETLLLFLKE